MNKYRIPFRSKSITKSCSIRSLRQPALKKVLYFPEQLENTHRPLLVFYGSMGKIRNSYNYSMISGPKKLHLSCTEILYHISIKKASFLVSFF
ncbi:hypothetical protein RUMCAL_00968 [Ruminococcus callidus ATCC 27760]|uniref:Uncharacterized protein n=1 Tax=Ruminococcus callidus ATCC 27760 TaxID=411473 RepID=U2MBG8_9FIRM|nr:hypothetical protein RUMCAL_00968 [Ruminococcus callidus ATCC 27760]